jgi:hypothetical protein
MCVPFKFVLTSTNLTAILARDTPVLAFKFRCSGEVVPKSGSGKLRLEWFTNPKLPIMVVNVLLSRMALYGFTAEDDAVGGEARGGRSERRCAYPLGAS